MDGFDGTLIPEMTSDPQACKIGVEIREQLKPIGYDQIHEPYTEET
jgi:hypothetical protein